MPHHNPWPWYETGPGIEPGTFGLADECSTTELTLLLKIYLDATRDTQLLCMSHSSNISPPYTFFVVCPLCSLPGRIPFRGPLDMGLWCNNVESRKWVYLSKLKPMTDAPSICRFCLKSVHCLASWAAFRNKYNYYSPPPKKKKKRWHHRTSYPSDNLLTTDLDLCW